MRHRNLTTEKFTEIHGENDSVASTNRFFFKIASANQNSFSND